MEFRRAHNCLQAQVDLYRVKVPNAVVQRDSVGYWDIWELSCEVVGEREWKVVVVFDMRRSALSLAESSSLTDLQHKGLR